MRSIIFAALVLTCTPVYAQEHDLIENMQYDAQQAAYAERLAIVSDA